MQKPVKVYTPLMRYERILFAIEDVELPFPVTYRQIGFFITTVVFMFILVHLPVFNMFQSAWLFNYVAVPAGITWFLTKFKLDGKAPHQYVWGYINYQLNHGIYSRYEKAEESSVYSYQSKVSYRKREDNE